MYLKTLKRRVLCPSTRSPPHHTQRNGKLSQWKTRIRYTLPTDLGPRPLLLPAQCRAGVTDLQHTKHKLPPLGTHFLARRQKYCNPIIGSFPSFVLSILSFCCHSLSHFVSFNVGQVPLHCRLECILLESR